MLLSTNLPGDVADDGLIQLLFTTTGLSAVGAIYRANTWLCKPACRCLYTLVIAVTNCLQSSLQSVFFFFFTLYIVPNKNI